MQGELMLLERKVRLVRSRQKVMLVELDYKDLVIEYDPVNSRCIGHFCSSEEGDRISELSSKYLELAQDACGSDFEKLVRLHLEGTRQTTRSHHSTYGNVTVRTGMCLPDIRKFHPWY